MSRRPPVGVTAIVASLALVAGVHAVRSAPVEPPMQSFAAAPRPDLPTVVKVVDGESFDMRRAGEVVRVRLLNVDAPDVATDISPAQCGSAEAKAWLQDRLPPGTPVTVRTDDLQYDWYQRELGWVTTADGESVNTGLVRQGLAAAVAREPNVAHKADVAAAQKAAAVDRVGLFAPNVRCTLEARVSSQVAEITDATRRAKLISTVSYERSMRTLGRAMAEVRDLRADLGDAGDTAEGRMIGQAAVARLQARLAKATAGAERLEERIVAAEEARIERELAAERARRAAEKAAAERAAAEKKAAEKKAAEDEAAEEKKEKEPAEATKPPTSPPAASTATRPGTPPVAPTAKPTPPAPATTTKP